MRRTRGGGSKARRFIARGVVLLILGPLLLGAVLLLLPLFPPAPLARIPTSDTADSVELVAGARYRAGALQRFLLGSHYREVWTQPVTVEVLRLERIAGGLTATREGGGVQTRTLHLASASGRRFVFRSTDKENFRLLNSRMGRTLIAWILVDQTSSTHPASALVAAPLQEAVGLPFPHPRLVVLPADPRLGPFAERFAGLLGTFLESPSDYARDPADSGTAEVKDSEEVFALLDSAASHQVDARAFLTARILDLFLNDWDRHQGQWRWAARPEPWGTLWRPIPVDRDQAFAWYDGAVLALARVRIPKLVEFRSDDVEDIEGLTINSARLDRWLLSGLERPVWDSVAAFVQIQLSDSVIDAAVRRMPAPYWRISGPLLAGTLKQRRDKLRAIATEFYQYLARHPEVHVARSGETAQLIHDPDGSIELRLARSSGGDDPATPFARRFIPGETERIDLHLPNGMPQVVESGRGPGRITLRFLDGLGREISPPP